ncbi:DUF4352 domain-containing protein [Planctomonas psychrotolerans]|uniref:DUF4352 domain-containing protein n=1 Tax=Planctomonas psychrotolerans TaxID=2528712 RepID=UPI00123A6E93|nr:DUF4352 domain-containing protein [Planctomonas psychrotolerans]
MKRTLAASALVSMIALTSGCAAETPQAADAARTPSAENLTTQTPTPTPTPTPESKYGAQVKNDHGNLMKEFGQLAGLTSAANSDVEVATFIVTGIQLDPVCNSGFAEPPRNGHYALVNVNIETLPELAQEEITSLYFDSYAWQAYDAEGKRVNDPVGNSWTCMDVGSLLPTDIGPGQSVSGDIVLDLPSTTGSIALTMGGPAGWEWTY